MTQGDAQGCALTVSETGARDGALLTIANVSANSATIADSAGVQETLGGSTITLAQYDAATFLYRSDRWIQVAANQAAATQTLTGKTYDAEGTGNVLTIPFVEWWPAASRDNFGASSAYQAVWNTPLTNFAPSIAYDGGGVSDGTHVNAGIFTFEDGSTEQIQRTFWLPSDWTGTLSLDVLWTTAATSGNAVWQAQTACAADGETDDPSFNAAQTVTDAAKASTQQLNTATFSSLTTTGCAAGELLHIKVFRDPSHASDTIAATANFFGARFTYRRAI